MGLEERRKVDTNYSFFSFFFFLLIKKGRLEQPGKAIILFRYDHSSTCLQETAQKRLKQTCSIKSHTLPKLTKKSIEFKTANTYLTIYKLQQD
jgi:hypothetical protein